MEELLHKLEMQTEAFDKLKNVKMEFGLFEEDSSKKVSYRTFDLEGNNIGKDTATLYEIMYLTDKGTISLPSYKILDKLGLLIMNRMDDFINKVLDRILKEEKINKVIEEELKAFESYCNLFVVGQAVDLTIQDYNRIDSSINGENTELKTIYDLNDLKKCIKCKFFLKS